MIRIRPQRSAFALLAMVLASLSMSLLFAAPPASADTVDDATSALKTDNLYVASNLGSLKIDESGARSVLSSSIKIAVLPSGSGDAYSIAQRIGAALDPNAASHNVTVGVFVGNNFNAASSKLCTGYASQAAKRAVNDNLSQLKSDSDVTNTIKSFVDLVNTAPSGSACGKSSGGGTGTGTGGTSDLGQSKKSSLWAPLAVFGLAGAGIVGALVYNGKRKTKRQLADARALIQPYFDRLAGDINTIVPGTNPVAQQAMSDASERYNSAGSQLATADSVAKLGGARRTILEGLQATVTARKALGLDPGPELPPLAESTAPQLAQAQTVNVNGQTVQGYPSYTPGAPYYFAGGGGYAGGWYSMPFWQTLLIAEALSPGWGWGFGSGFGWGGMGMGGGGYGSGYGAGYHDASQQQQDSGSSGGGWGDWGGGGGSGFGDWGGGGGGGDWGGGGGDSGGGSW